MIENPEILHWSRQEAENFLLAFEQLAKDLTVMSIRGVENGKSKYNSATEEAACP